MSQQQPNSQPLLHLNQAQHEHVQWRFVFVTSRVEANHYSLVHPSITSASCELVDPKDSSITVTDYYTFDDTNYDWPADAPKVTVQVDQLSGQVNVCVTAPEHNGSDPVARSPAHVREQIRQGERIPQTPIKAAQIIKPRPPPSKNLNTRAIAPSPAGTAIRTPGGIDFVPAGSIRTPSGTVWTPKGSSYSPGGTGYWPIGTTTTDQGMLTPSGTLYDREGVGYGPSGHVYTPNGTAYSPSGVAYTSWAGKYKYSIASPASPAPGPPSVPSINEGSTGSPAPPPVIPLTFDPVKEPEFMDISAHPPTPFHDKSPIQLQSPQVYGGAVRLVVTQTPVIQSPVELPQQTDFMNEFDLESGPPMPPRTEPLVFEQVKPPPISPGPSPQPLELKPEEITVATAVRGPHVEREQRQVLTSSHAGNPMTRAPLLY
eukprot:Blabericola_migrator_1__770@NODE_1192_length_5164_cov_232_230332_g809_i0_p1_GENE_NODE_1192_length_5164_cov_232_230332_g809_i0NODE_1192_length_5164_cov_232_230332_g809_i0_p1_ORF_typecomplete_len429_score65_51_NODE_1192_length_5164_cov_232_230332_g809_i010472333